MDFRIFLLHHPENLGWIQRVCDEATFSWNVASLAQPTRWATEGTTSPERGKQSHIGLVPRLREGSAPWMAVRFKA